MRQKLNIILLFISLIYFIFDRTELVIKVIFENVYQQEQYVIISQYEKRSPRLIWALDNYSQNVDEHDLVKTMNLFFIAPTSYTLGGYLALLNLSKNYESSIEFVSLNEQLCMDSFFCRFQVGKAFYLLGEFQKIPKWWKDDRLYYQLIQIGNLVPANETTIDEKLELYFLLISTFPDDSNIYKSIGELYRYKGNWQKANYYFKKAYETSPEDPIIICLYSESLVYLKQSISYALNLCSDYVEESDNIWLYEKLSRMYEFSGDIELARQWLVFAVERHPNTKEPLSWLNEFNNRNSK